jgi:type IV pilus assembly protein PilV
VNNTLYQACYSAKQGGFTLIEILITTLIFSFAMLSLSQLQNTASKQASSTALHNLATVQALNILEQMRADRVAVLAGQYNLAQNTTTSSSDTISANVLQQWRSELTNLLPKGQGSIECNASGRCEISIFWNNVVPSQTSSKNTQLSFVLSSQL